MCKCTGPIRNSVEWLLYHHTISHLDGIHREAFVVAFFLHTWDTAWSAKHLGMKKALEMKSGFSLVVLNWALVFVEYLNFCFNSVGLPFLSELPLALGFQFSSLDICLLFENNEQTMGGAEILNYCDHYLHLVTLAKVFPLAAPAGLGCFLQVGVNMGPVWNIMHYSIISSHNWMKKFNTHEPLLKSKSGFLYNLDT